MADRRVAEMALGQLVPLMIEVLCRRCDQRGRLSVTRLLADYGPNAAMGAVLRAQIGDCPKREAQNIAERCSVYCPDLVRLFFRPSAAG